MPPSPAMRCSPGRELRAENHKRGRSLDCGLLVREKDDDLALFNEMQTRERENFLLQSADVFDDSFSTKLKYFSDFKLGISIPVRGESSGLLNADGEKNDYDWLLTPPETPLFPSLDDEAPPVNLVHRGRPRSQPIPITRSTTMEKSHRSSRSSASPHRLSPSPRSGNTTILSRGRPSSAPHSSPAPVQRPITPSRRPSTPPNKSSTTGMRSSTPTTRRTSTGSSSTACSSARRGASPVRTSRGNSTSPKLHAWQSNLPGFSSDAPPNLRTSLADRPASYVRGSSPASRNGSDSFSKVRRQSISPTASRSASSSYSHDRDQFSSHSKGSVASFGDDDIDSLQSIPVGISDCSTTRKFGIQNSRALAYSKKPARTLSSSSAPKKSFDSTLRQLDHRKSPQNMFRPLLSSVPTSTFYVGKANSAHRPMTSRNSSVTTSSNASSEQGGSVAQENGGSERDQDDITKEWGKAPYPGAQDEVFAFDKVDEVNEDTAHELNDGSTNIGNHDFNGGCTTEVKLGESAESTSHNVSMEIASESLNVEGDSLEFDCHAEMISCSKCGKKFPIIKSVEGNNDICPDCSEEMENLTLSIPEKIMDFTETNPLQSEVISEENKPSDELVEVSEFPEISNHGKVVLACVENNISKGQSFNVKQSHSCLPDNSFETLKVEEEECVHVDHQVVGQITVVTNKYDSDTSDQYLQNSNAYSNLKVDITEGAGISLLLKRSSSIRGPVFQGRAFSVANIPYDDPSYARENMNSLRSSVGHGSASASSSVDMSSSKQMGTRVQRQLSGKRIDMENYRHDMNARPRSSCSSLSGISNHMYQALVLSKSTSEENFEVSVANMDHRSLEETSDFTQQEGRASEHTEHNVTSASFVRKSVLEEDIFKHADSCRTMDISASELSSHSVSNHLEGTSLAAVPNDEDCVSSGNAEDFPNNAWSISDLELSAIIPESSFMEEGAMLSGSVNFVEVPAHGALDTMSGELENDHEFTSVSQTDCAFSPNSKSTMEEFDVDSVLTHSEDMLTSISESNHPHNILEDSTVTVDGPAGNKSRSLTLDEATDTILFCSSIIHDLAHQAATIALEKDNPAPQKSSWPTVAILGKPNSNRKELRGRTPSKHNPKPRKIRQRRVETDVTPSTEIETGLKNIESSVDDPGVQKKLDSMRPQKPESKCNCTVM